MVSDPGTYGHAVYATVERNDLIKFYDNKNNNGKATTQIQPTAKSLRCIVYSKPPVRSDSQECCSRKDMTDLQCSPHRASRGGGLSGKEIRKLNFGRRDSPALEPKGISNKLWSGAGIDPRIADHLLLSINLNVRTEQPTGRCDCESVFMPCTSDKARGFARPWRRLPALHRTLRPDPALLTPRDPRLRFAGAWVGRRRRALFAIIGSYLVRRCESGVHPDEALETLERPPSSRRYVFVSSTSSPLGIPARQIRPSGPVGRNPYASRMSMYLSISCWYPAWQTTSRIRGFPSPVPNRFSSFRRRLSMIFIPVALLRASQISTAPHAMRPEHLLPARPPAVGKEGWVNGACADSTFASPAASARRRRRSRRRPSQPGSTNTCGAALSSSLRRRRISAVMPCFPRPFVLIQLSSAEDFASSAARSNSVTRTSTSSISIALAAWSKTLSAALTRVECGAFVST